MRFQNLGRSVEKEKKKNEIRRIRSVELGGSVPRHNILGAYENMETRNGGPYLLPPSP